MVLTYEQKKKVPRSLRGAKNSKKRFWCSFCNEFHKDWSPCKNNPKYEEYMKNREKGYLEKYHTNILPKRLEGLKRFNDSPERKKAKTEKQKQTIAKRPASWKRKLQAPDSFETRIRKTLAQQKRRAKETAFNKEEEKGMLPSPSMGTTADFLRELKNKSSEKDEFYGGSIHKDVFDDDDFDPFH